MNDRVPSQFALGEPFALVDDAVVAYRTEDPALDAKIAALVHSGEVSDRRGRAYHLGDHLVTHQLTLGLADVAAMLPEATIGALIEECWAELGEQAPPKELLTSLARHAAAEGSGALADQVPLRALVPGMAARDEESAETVLACAQAVTETGSDPLTVFRAGVVFACWLTDRAYRQDQPPKQVTATELPDIRTALAELYAGSDGWAMFGAGLGLFPFASSPTGVELHHVVDAIGAGVRAAELYSVELDVCRLLEQAAASMPAERLAPTDSPSVDGLAVFTDPVRTRDQQGRPSLIRAVSWTLEGTDVHVVGYTDRLRLERPVDYLLSDWRRVEDGMRHRSYGTALVPAVWLRWPLGSEHASFLTQRSANALEPSGEPATRVSQLTGAQQLVAALWLVMRQKITESAPQRPARAAARRAQRAGLPALSTLTVIRLRRRETASTGGSQKGPVNWRQRWIVRSHWRHVYLPSTGGHRLRLIAAFVKGPPDKPLRGGDRVTIVGPPPAAPEDE